MLRRLRERNPTVGLGWILFYEFARSLLCLSYTILFRARVFHAERVPTTGSLLIAANHQSFLDPPLVGGFVTRHVDYLARASLFRFKPFGFVLKAVNCIPLRDESGDAGAIREALRQLESQHAVLIFPEGARTPDGAMHSFKRGVGLLVKRARCPVVPAAVEGCFDAWPRHRKGPRVWGSPIAVMYGDPIPYEELMRDGVDAALRRLEREIDAMRLKLRMVIREQTRGVYPAAGRGDEPLVSADRNDSADTRAEAAA